MQHVLFNYRRTIEAIKRKYKLKAVKEIAKNNSIRLSSNSKNKKWADSIREIFSDHEEDDDDEADDNMVIVKRMMLIWLKILTMVVNAMMQAPMGHCFNIRLQSDTMNASFGYASHRRMWERHGCRIVTGILDTLIGVLEFEKVPVAKPSSVVQFDVCKNAPKQMYVSVLFRVNVSYTTLHVSVT